MTRRQEAALWREMGRAYESENPPLGGLRVEASWMGLPLDRIRWEDDVGAGWSDVYLYSVEERREAADHRALTCYLMAEMVLDGRAPGGTP